MESDILHSPYLNSRIDHPLSGCKCRSRRTKHVSCSLDTIVCEVSVSLFRYVPGRNFAGTSSSRCPLPSDAVLEYSSAKEDVKKL